MTKETLRDYVPMKRELAQIREILQEIQEGKYNPSAKNTSKPAKVMEYLDEGGDIVALYKQKEAELKAKLLEIEDAIKCLGPRERTIFRLYYINGLTWEEVCVSMHYSWRQIHNIHKKALEKLKDE